MNATLRVIDHEVAGRTRPGDMERVSAGLTEILTSELDEAQRYLGFSTELILIAALGRAIARTLGEGVVAVDLPGNGRPSPEPGADPTVVRFRSFCPVPLACVTEHKASANEMLGAVHCTLAAVPRQASEQPQPLSDILFSYVGHVPEPPSDETRPGTDHALELRVSRTAGLVHLDWWYDTRRLDAYTVEELAEQFPFAMIELTSEAIPLIPEAVAG
jgi:hypothetical protein